MGDDVGKVLGTNLRVKWEHVGRKAREAGGLEEYRTWTK